jgi:hypothetical protein
MGFDRKKYMREYMLKRYFRMRQELVIRLGDKCAVCDSKDNLELDHVDPSKKTFKWVYLHTKTKEEIEKELLNTQLLCADCHMAKTVSEKKPFTHGTMYAWMKVKCNCDICFIAKRRWHNKRNQARVAQRQEARDLSPLQCEFESRPEH